MPRSTWYRHEAARRRGVASLTRSEYEAKGRARRVEAAALGITPEALLKRGQRALVPSVRRVTSHYKEWTPYLGSKESNPPTSPTLPDVAYFQRDRTGARASTRATHSSEHVQSYGGREVQEKEMLRPRNGNARGTVGKPP
jgi:hypothetical protein